MPLFRRLSRDRSHNPGEARAPAARLLDEASVHAALTALVDAASAPGTAFCALCVVPQLLPGERIAAAEAEVVARAICDQLRDGDQAGAIANGAYVVVLPRTDAAHAQVVAHRLATEFTVRSAHVNRRNWRVGIAAFPEDGLSAETLVAAALAAAKRGTRAA